MEFLDEEDALPADGPADSRAPRLGPPDRQQIMLRRLMAVVGGVILLILIVLGVKGCLDARHKQAIKDYVREVSSLTTESKQVSDDLFRLLNDPKALTPLDYEAQIKSDRGAADSLAMRADKLDAPGDMSQAQRAVETTFRLRQLALTSIANEVGPALGREGRQPAIDQIAQDMQTLLGGDVVYGEMAKPGMETVLKGQGINDVQVPGSVFLPEGTSWLDPTKVSTALSKVSGGAGAATPGVHGLGLIQTTANGVTLDPAAPATVPASGTLTFDVQVQNQGQSEETDVVATVTANGKATEQKISRIGPGETADVMIPVSPSPSKGSQLSVDVEVQPVPGEQVTDNNKSSYKVTYG